MTGNSINGVYESNMVVVFESDSTLPNYIIVFRVAFNLD
jgi:hypothetical protein